MPLLRNDALRKHPYIQRQPTTEREWSEFIRAFNAQAVDSLGGGFSQADVFTPTWPAFDSSPSGDLSYFFTERAATLFVAPWGSGKGASANLTDTPTVNLFTIGNLPDDVNPSSSRSVLCEVIYNNTNIVGKAVLSGSNSITMYLGTVVSSTLQFSSNTWTGTCGLPLGWLITYPL